MNKKKRIAFVLSGMSQGGAERVISILSRDYAEHGWNTDIIVLLSNRVDYDLHKTTRIIDLTRSARLRVSCLPYWFFSLRDYAKREQPDIMLTFFPQVSIIAFWACRNLVPKIYASERIDPRYDGRSKVTDLLSKYTYAKLDGMVFQTRLVESYYSNIRNYCIIPNPIEIRNYALTKKQKKIVNVGRLAPQKNRKMLITVFAEIAELFPDYALYIYGEGYLRHDLETQARSLGVGNRVFFEGWVANVHECISDAELFVLSSDYEGLSNALLEAMMMGIPCISTDCAGASEYIDGTNGMVVPVGDSVAMSEAIKRVLEDDYRRDLMGINGKETAKRFSSRAVLEKWHSFMDV